MAVEESRMRSGSMVEGVRREVLGNGLTVLVREDHSAPVAAVVTLVRSGYFHETDEQVGLAHVCEHMYFNGTTRRPGAEDIAREVKGLGGSLNAGTYYDSTSYFVVLPADRYEQALDVQADAFADPLMDEEVLGKEMGAIIQEARRKLDNPSAVARERMYAEAFDRHRIRRWRIGTDEQLRGYEPEHLKRFWQDHYVPSNAILALVGDVDADEALATIRRQFGGLPKADAKREGSPAEPDRAPGLRYGRTEMDVKEATSCIGFPTVPVLHPDALPLDLLAAVLCDGRSSRLVRELRERQALVASVSVNSHQIDDVGFFDVTLTAEAGRLDEARQALFRELGRALREPPSEGEMARARNRIRASFVLAGSTMLGQARALSSFESLGGYGLVEEHLQDLLAVRPEDVLRVARTWLDPGRVALHEVVPEGEPPPRPEPAALETALRAALGERPEAGERPPPAERGAAAAVVSAPGGAQDWSVSDLAGGVRLVHRRNPGLPTVALAASLTGGRRADLEVGGGVTSLGASLLPRGARGRDAEAFAEAFESLGANLSPHVSDDAWGLGTVLLAERGADAAGLLFDALLGPAFDAGELERARELQLLAQRRQEDQPLLFAHELARRAAFDGQLPGLPSLGTPESLAALDRDALIVWHQRALAPDELLVAVVGDVEREEALAMVAAAVSSWIPAEDAGTAPSAGHAEFREGAQRIEERRKQQSAQALLFPGVPEGHEDEAALDVLAACTGSLGGRFFEEIRTKRGLAYVVATANFSGRDGGWFGGFLATAPEDEERSRDVLLGEARRLASEPPQGAELERAREYLCGQHALSLQGNAAQAGVALGLLGSGLGLDEIERHPERIRAVTSEAVAAAAARYLDPARVAKGIVRAVG
jgi:zinc protease